MPSFQIHCGDALDKLKGLDSESVQTCVTSPPYFGLRDYGIDGQVGLESTPEEYTAKMVEVFREVKRVLRNDGTVWVNLGDSYAGGNGRWAGDNRLSAKQTTNRGCINTQNIKIPQGCKPKDLIGMPWRVAFALQGDGWYLRSDIIWNKPNPMPESVTDRPTKAHEYIFLLSKSARYFYDSDAIKEPAAHAGKVVSLGEKSFSKGQANGRGIQASGNGLAEAYTVVDERNKRSVWTVNSSPYSEAHFATFPPKLIEPCILAGTSEKGCCAACGAPYERVVEKSSTNTRPNSRSDNKPFACEIGAGHTNGKGKTTLNHSHITSTVGWQATCKHNSSIIPCTVLDPFAGSGTTGLVALRHGRNFVGIELNPEYVEMARRRITNDAPLFNEQVA